MEKRADKLSETVREFYKHLGSYTGSDFSVNRAHVEALLDLFSDDVFYVRCGRPINGKQALKTFYEEERRLYGTHRLSKIVVEESGDGSVAVLGDYNGVTREQKKLSMRFSDFFDFDSQGKIRYRETITG